MKTYALFLAVFLSCGAARAIESNMWQVVTVNTNTGAMKPAAGGPTNWTQVLHMSTNLVSGPLIDGKRAFLFTDGTNWYGVNVNSVTNALY